MSETGDASFFFFFALLQLIEQAFMLQDGIEDETGTQNEPIETATTTTK